MLVVSIVLVVLFLAVTVFSALRIYNQRKASFNAIAEDFARIEARQSENRKRENEMRKSVEDRYFDRPNLRALKAQVLAK